eukprot:TRINITY_DN3323_c0_g2_i1.p1 TRINITY_DN3323_c0_g2~~TRINITY_DN3323_c0_g2_i1.p1  ORF type:complete len:187 (+),score=37.60 TRINITY_DN3323_c0_g2_i1:481-1041(+)
MVYHDHWALDNIIDNIWSCLCCDFPPYSKLCDLIVSTNAKNRFSFLECNSQHFVWNALQVLQLPLPPYLGSCWKTNTLTSINIPDRPDQPSIQEIYSLEAHLHGTTHKLRQGKKCTFIIQPIPKKGNLPIPGPPSWNRFIGCEQNAFLFLMGRCRYPYQGCLTAEGRLRERWLDMLVKWNSCGWLL